MAEEVKNPEASNVASELDAALTTLDSALAEASRSVAVIRSNIAQIAALAEVVREMETAMARARQGLRAPPAAARQTATAPPLRPVPPPEPMPQPPEPEAETGEALAQPSQPEAKASEELAQSPELEATAAAPTMPSEPEPSRPVSHCLRLGVSSKAGSLDLKAVDGSVNENPAVVDVALLDYDGRHATLKLWVNGAADPGEVQQALLQSLRRRLGDDRYAEVRIDFEEESAA